MSNSGYNVLIDKPITCMFNRSCTVHDRLGTLRVRTCIRKNNVFYRPSSCGLFRFVTFLWNVYEYFKK